jgi:hypothetical protein
VHLDRDESGFQGERLVEEPWRQREHDLVTGVGDGLHGDGDGAEAARRHPQMVSLPRQVDNASQRSRRGLLRQLLAELVGEPELVLGQRRGTQGVDVRLQRHFVGVAEGEVEDARLEPPLLVAGSPHEVEEQVERPR